MGIEINSGNAVCSKCGTAYSRRKGYFPVNYGVLYKGVGHIHVCRDCIDAIYNGYLSQCNNAADAVRQVCRKLDLYWSEKVYRQVEKKTTARSMMTQYITKINTSTYVGKSYDDTLSDEGTLWNFRAVASDGLNTLAADEPNEDVSEDEDIEISDDVKALWGTGYTPQMYQELEQRRSYWMSKLPKDLEVDIGTEAIIKQICAVELDINRDRAAGRSVDKNVNTLNTLLGSAALKPTQKKDSADSAIDNTPFGVWIRRWENQRPVPEADPELQDVDGIVKYVSVWFLGHLCKMLGIKNTYCKLYEDEIAKMRVERPEYDEDDDETMFNDIFGSSASSENDDESAMGGDAE